MSTRQVIKMVVLMAAATGCGASQSHLAPAAAANQLEDVPDAARVQTHGITMTAQVDVWPGIEEVKSKVTPVHLDIQNGTDEPIRVQYGHLALVSDQGQRFAALPPFQIKGEIDKPVAVYSAPLTRSWTYTGFTIAPYYTSIYPDVPVAVDPFMYDSPYYDRYYTVWTNISLPTPTMVNYALPEGDIQPGGRVEGFVYFERVGDKAKKVNLRSDFIDAKDGTSFATAEIPFDVTED